MSEVWTRCRITNLETNMTDYICPDAQDYATEQAYLEAAERYEQDHDLSAAEEEGYEQELQRQAEEAAAKAAPKPYKVERVATKTPGTGRYKITKADGTVYWVSFGSKAMHCNCPDSVHRRPGKCKHCRAIAMLIQRPELVADE